MPGDFAPADPPTRSLAGTPSPRSAHAARSRGSLAAVMQTHQSPVGATDAERGAWLARRIEDRDTGRDARIAMRMRLFDRQGRVRERALSISSLRGGPGRPVPGDRSLVRFTHPADIKGTAFLVWEQPNADDERFLYLPSLGRVRRIAGSEAQESFVGSDLTYEDIGGREFENYTYRLIEGPAPAPGPRPMAPDIPCSCSSRETATPAPGSRECCRTSARTTSWLCAPRFSTSATNFRRRYDAVRLEQVSSYWTVLELKMSDSLERTRTELVLEKVEYNIGLKPDDFSRRELERGSGGRP